MDARSLQDLQMTPLLAAAAAANTAAATTGSGNWIDTANLEGDIAIAMAVQSLTGSLAGKLQCGDDNTGASPVDIAGATFATAVAGTPQMITVPANSLAKRFLGFVGTIVTGPADITVLALYRKQYS